MKAVPKMFIVFSLTMSSLSQAKNFGLDSAAVQRIFNIAQQISRIQPHLSENKYIQYAHGIYHASREFGIEAQILIAITQKESSFREGLPEGAAGERGICQIRKAWLENPKFMAYFKESSVEHLENPKFAFRYAAWILRDLKNSVKKSELPYWTAYNSPTMPHRFNYWVQIQKHMMKLQERPRPVVQASTAAPRAKAEPNLVPGRKLALGDLGSTIR